MKSPSKRNQFKGATMARELSKAAQAAKMIRKNLKAQGLVCRVVSDNFSMGDSVDVYMTDARPELREAVSLYCAKFQYGKFNGMEDIYEYTNSRDDLPQTKYCHVHNELSAELRAKIFANVRAEWSGGQELPEDYEAAQNLQFQGQWVSQFVYREFAQANSTFWQSIDAQRKAA